MDLEIWLSDLSGDRIYVDYESVFIVPGHESGLSELRVPPSLPCCRDRSFGGSLPSFLAAFLNAGQVSDQDAAEIERMLEEYRKKK